MSRFSFFFSFFFFFHFNIRTPPAILLQVRIYSVLVISKISSLNQCQKLSLKSIVFLLAPKFALVTWQLKLCFWMFICAKHRHGVYLLGVSFIIVCTKYKKVIFQLALFISWSLLIQRFMPVFPFLEAKGTTVNWAFTKGPMSTNYVKVAPARLIHSCSEVRSEVFVSYLLCR